MSKVRLYIDEDAMDGDVVRGLRSRSVDVMTAVDAHRIQCPDEKHLQFAADTGRSLYSFNVRDFHELHTEWMSAGRDHAGLILSQ